MAIVTVDAVAEHLRVLGRRVQIVEPPEPWRDLRQYLLVWDNLDDDLPACGLWPPTAAQHVAGEAEWATVHLAGKDRSGFALPHRDGGDDVIAFAVHSALPELADPHSILDVDLRAARRDLMPEILPSDSA